MSEKVTVREHGKIRDVEVAHQFSPVRALVIFDGLYVLADRKSIDEWELSGRPATSDEEKRVVKHYVDELASKGTQVKVTPPDEES